GQLADLVAVGLFRTRLEPERTLDQERRRRRLRDERERAVFEHRDLDRDDEAFLGLRPVVVLLAEVHDVERVGAQRRTDGRRRCRLPGGKSETDLPDDSLSHGVLSTAARSAKRTEPSPPQVNAPAAGVKSAGRGPDARAQRPSLTRRRGADKAAAGPWPPKVEMSGFQPK